MEGRGEAKKRKKPHKSCRCDQALLFRMRHHLCRQEVSLAGTRQLRSQGLVPVHAHRTEEITGSEGWEGANGVGGEIRVGGGNGDEYGAATGTERGWRRMKERKMGTRTKARTGWERERGRGWRPVDERRMRTGTGAGTETRAIAERRTGTRIGTGMGARIGSRRADERRRSARNRRVVQRLGGGRGCHKFVPVLKGDGLKIAPPGDLLNQPPGEMS